LGIGQDEGKASVYSERERKKKGHFHLRGAALFRTRRRRRRKRQQRKRIVEITLCFLGDCSIV